MSYGRMNSFINIISSTTVKDKEGFSSQTETVLASARAYREFRRGTERWANLAAFSEATCLFRFRTIPGIVIKPDMAIQCDGLRYRIISAEDVRGRNMYVELLASVIEPTKY